MINEQCQKNAVNWLKKSAEQGNLKSKAILKKIVEKQEHEDYLYNIFQSIVRLTLISFLGLGAIGVVLYGFRKKSKWKIEWGNGILILLAGILIQVSVLGVAKYDMCESFRCGNDMASYANALWNTNFVDKFLETETLLDAHGKSTSLLSDHFSPTLFFFVPLYQLFPSEFTLAYLPIFMQGIATFLLYMIGFKVLRSKALSIAIALLYFYHPALVKGIIDNGYGFHLDVLSPPFLMGLVLALLYRHFILYLMLLFLFLGIKENLPFITLLLGIKLVLTPQDRKWGWWTMGISVAFTSLALVIWPWISGYSTGHGAGILQKVWGEGLWNLDFGTTLLSWRSLLMMFPAIFALEWAILALPSFIIYTIAGVDNSLEVWYSPPIVAIISIAMVFGTARLHRGLQNRLFHWEQKGALLMLAMFLVMIVYAAYSTLRYYEDFYDFNRTNKTTINYTKKDIEELIEQIPPESYLASTISLLIHIANRDHMMIDTHYDRAEFYLLSATSAYPHDLEFMSKIKTLHDIGAVELIEKRPSDPNITSGHLYLFKKTLAQEDFMGLIKIRAPHLISDFERNALN